MKKKHILLILASLALVTLLSACGNRNFLPTSWPGTTIEGDTMYVAYNNFVYAINDNGQETDRFPEEAERASTYFAAPAFVGNEQMIVGSYNNILYSFNRDSGNVDWEYKDNNRFIADPLVTDGLVIAPNADGLVYALDADNRGKEVWVFSPHEKNKDNKPIWATPLLEGENVFIASMDGNIYALDIKSGTLIWKTELGNAMVSSPVLGEDGTLYIGSFDSQVIALDSQDGREIWRADTENWIWGSPTLDGDMLYVTDLSGNMYALNAADGSQEWSVAGDGAATGSPLVDGEDIYFVTENDLYAVSKEGAVRWSRSIDETSLYGSPVKFGDFVIAKSSGGSTILYAYDVNGQAQWQFTPEN